MRDCLKIFTCNPRMENIDSDQSIPEPANLNGAACDGERVATGFARATRGKRETVMKINERAECHNRKRPWIRWVGVASFQGVLQCGRRSS